MLNYNKPFQTGCLVVSHVPLADRLRQSFGAYLYASPGSPYAQTVRVAREGVLMLVLGNLICENKCSYTFVLHPVYGLSYVFTSELKLC